VWILWGVVACKHLSELVRVALVSNSLQGATRRHKGVCQVCKTFMRRFDSDPRLQFLPIIESGRKSGKAIGLHRPKKLSWVVGARLHWCRKTTIRRASESRENQKRSRRSPFRVWVGAACFSRGELDFSPAEIASSLKNGLFRLQKKGTITFSRQCERTPSVQIGCGEADRKLQRISFSAASWVCRTLQNGAFRTTPDLCTLRLSTYLSFCILAS
jgi:hypothetical protein